MSLYSFDNCILGQAYGDSIGLLTEFLNEEQIKTHYGNDINDIDYNNILKDSHRLLWKLGDWTDDTDMMILCMKEISENYHINEKSLALKFYNWYKHGFPETGDVTSHGIGNTCRMVINEKKFLKKPLKTSKFIWKLSSKKNASNGAVMRTSIFGYYKNIDDLVINCLKACMITHYSPDCKISCLFISSLNHFLMHTSDDVEVCIKNALDIAVNNSKSKKAKKTLYRYIYHVDFFKENFMKHMGYTYKPVLCTVWALRALHNCSHLGFENTIKEIIKKGGDADTNACVASASCAIRYMPIDLKNKLKDILPYYDFLMKEINIFSNRINS